MKKNKNLEVLINPELQSGKGDLYGIEGCLSVPNMFGIVKRWKEIEVSFVDRSGDSKRMQLCGLEGAVFQHELDHLNGILFIDYLKMNDLFHASVVDLALARVNELNRML